MGPRFGVVVNGRAGRGSAGRIAERVRDLFGQDSATVSVTTTRGGDLLRRAAERWAGDGCDALVAGGGDGTISTVGDVALEHALPLGVLPLGTFNHFAKDLGLPLALEEAVGVLRAGATRRVDVGRANGALFVNNVSIGVYPRLIALRERHRAHGAGKWIAALWAALAVLRRHPFVDLRLETPDGAVARRTPFVLIANNAYRMEGLRPQARDRLDAGELAVYTYSAHRRLGLLGLGLRVMLKGAARVRELEVRSTREVTVVTPRHDPRLAVDGELTTLASPLSATILPGALEVFAPSPDSRP
jgi:diacylglycerol kinase family enzyme